MTSDRIKEIQEETAYPESRSVHQSLLQVWNECEQELRKELYSEEDIARAFNEGMACETMGKYIKGEDWVKTHKKEWFEQHKRK
jgi:hypothetical protein